MQGIKAFSSDMVQSYFPPEELEWLKEKIRAITTGGTGNLLYLNYSLLTDRYRDIGAFIPHKDGPEEEKLTEFGEITPLELARIYLLIQVINANPDLFLPKVRQLIQIADKEELRTFLKYLSLLPFPEVFTSVAVEALRTNIATVFDAIALDNPYPAVHFQEGQWNQMFLKAAFMERPLYRIKGIEERANATLARIISDYAHERWAASREVDPYIWRPVGPFLNSTLLKDMEKLLQSKNTKENIAGILCLKEYPQAEATTMLNQYLERYQELNKNTLDWAQVIT